MCLGFESAEKHAQFGLGIIVTGPTEHRGAQGKNLSDSERNEWYSQQNAFCFVMKQEVSGSTPVKARAVPFCPIKSSYLSFVCMGAHIRLVLVFCLHGCPYSFSIGKEISPACATSSAFPWRFGPLSKSAISIISIVLVVIITVVVIIVIIIFVVVVITIFIIVVVTIVVVVVVVVIIIVVVIITIVIIIVVIITLAQSGGVRYLVIPLTAASRQFSGLSSAHTYICLKNFTPKFAHVRGNVLTYWRGTES